VRHDEDGNPAVDKTELDLIMEQLSDPSKKLTKKEIQKLEKRQQKL
jgi:hypothetical protein